MDWTRNDHGIFGRMDVRRESECYFSCFYYTPFYLKVRFSMSELILMLMLIFQIP